MGTEVNVKTETDKPVIKTVRARPVKDRVPWQRMALSVFGITIITIKWVWGMIYLYTLPPHAMAAAASSNTNSDYAISVIVIFMISGKIFMDWKNNTASTVVEQASHVFERHEDKSEQIITTRTEGGAKAFAEDVE